MNKEKMKDIMLYVFVFGIITLIGAINIWFEWPLIKQAIERLGF